MGSAVIKIDNPTIFPKPGPGSVLYKVRPSHRIKDDRMKNYSAYIVFISKLHCRAAKDCFSRREFVQQTVEEENGGGSGEWGGGWHVPPCSPSVLTQIVPISASIYTVFHSVILNSVAHHNTKGREAKSAL